MSVTRVRPSWPLANLTRGPHHNPLFAVAPSGRVGTQKLDRVASWIVWPMSRSVMTITQPARHTGAHVTTVDEGLMADAALTAVIGGPHTCGPGRVSMSSAVLSSR